MTEGVVENCLKYSVIIPSYNSEETIVACLESILAQDINEPYEVIVVDSSSDATPELIRERFPSVRLKHFEQRVGSGTARNIGVEMARASHLLAFLDSDCVVQPGWLCQMVAAHESEYAAVGGPVLNGNPESLVSWAGYLAEFNQFLPKDGDCRDTGHIPTSNVSYKRYVFERYGGFPEEVVKQVDLLFHWQVCQQGEKLLLDPTIRVAHCHRAYLGDYLYHQFDIGRGTVQVLRRTNLPGSTLVRYRLLASVFLPALPLVKFIRSSYRFLKWRLKALWQMPLIFPLFALGLLYWAAGFACEVWNMDQRPRPERQ
jgi:GT2 family glycosyltransferase